MQNILNLINEFKVKTAHRLEEKDNDLLEEISSKLDGILLLKDRITKLNQEFLKKNNFSMKFDTTTDTMTFGKITLKLNRADENVPISVGNVTQAFSLSNNGLLDNKDYCRLKEIDYLLKSFYHEACRIIEISKKLPHFNKVKCKEVTIVRNKLIEHAGTKDKDANVTFDSITLSLSEGPTIKGLRKNQQQAFKSKGFNSDFSIFMTALEKSLEDSVKELK